MKQINSLLPADTEPLTFDDWYVKVYPKHVEKVQAEKEWGKLSDKDKHLATIDPPERLKHHAQWKDKQMIPSPRRYLLRKLWTDEIIGERTKEDEQQENDDGTIHSRFWTLLKQVDSRIEQRYGKTMPYAWKTSLKGLTGQQIARSMKYLIFDNDPSVPTLRKINQVLSIGRNFDTPKLKLLGNETKESTLEKHKSDMEDIRKGDFSGLSYEQLRG